MKRNDILVLLFGAIILGALFIEPAQALQATNAFARIFVNGANVFNALSYNDYLSFKAGSGITLSVEPHTVVISTTAGPSGDTNTAQIGDQGTHLSIFGSRYNATKNLLKTFVCTGSATCSTNSTDIQITVAASSGYTKLNNLDGGDAKIVATNATLTSTQATFKSLTGGTGITLTNGTKTITIATTGGSITALAANTTVTGVVAGDTNIFTITLTANSGNTIQGVLTGTSSVSGNAIRGAANVTNLNTRGYCHWTQISTTTANAVDSIVMNTVLTGRATNTGETAWIAAANTPMPIEFECSLVTGATPGSLKIWATPEATGATQVVKAGSFYIKSP